MFERASGLFGRVTLDYELALEERQNAACALLADKDHWLAQYQRIEAAYGRSQTEKEELPPPSICACKRLRPRKVLLAAVTRQRDEIAVELNVACAEQGEAQAALARQIAEISVAQSTIAELIHHREQIAAELEASLTEKDELADAFVTQAKELEALRCAHEEVIHDRKALEKDLAATNEQKAEIAGELLRARTAFAEVKKKLAELTSTK